MQEQRIPDNDTRPDPIHELWLIYCRLKDAETDPAAREQLISSTRTRLAHVLNLFSRYQFEPKQPDLTPDKEEQIC